MRRARQRPPGWAVTIGGVLAAAGGLAVLWRKPAARAGLKNAVPGFAERSKPDRRGDQSAAPAAGRSSENERGGASSDGGGEASHRQSWQCECGQAYLVAGQDRHQIYWLDGAEENDPVLADHCPACDRPLPAVSRANATD